MKVNSTKQNGVAIIAIQGKVMGGPDTGELDEKLYALEGKGAKTAIVDLASCEWINSSGLSILLHHYKKFRDTGGELKLANLTDRIERIMVISRLTAVFKVYDSVDAALKDS